MSDGSSPPSASVGRPLLDSAGTPFVVFAFVVPVAAALAAVGSRSIVLLNLVHVASGAIWAGTTMFVGGLFRPELLGLEPDVSGRVNAPLVPKNVFLFSGVSLAAPSRDR